MFNYNMVINAGKDNNEANYVLLGAIMSALSCESQCTRASDKKDI